MAYVVTENCIRCKFTDCADPCEFGCFREGPNFLVIDPDLCTDCGLCVAACQAEAIYAEDQVPAEMFAYIAMNAELARELPPITGKKDPLEDAEKWLNVPDKLQYLER